MFLLLLNSNRTHSSCFCTMTSALFLLVTITTRHLSHCPCKVLSHICSLRSLGSSWYLSKAHKNAYGKMTSGSVLVCDLLVSDVIDEPTQRRSEWSLLAQPTSQHAPGQHCDTSMAHLAQTTNHTLKWCLVCELKHCL